MTNMDLALLGQVVLGYIWQWVRGFARIPNWASWAVMGLSAVAVYVWITPSIVTDWQANWRYAVAGCVSFILAARGAASTTSDAKAAPPTNSL